MRPDTAGRIAQAIQLLNLDGCEDYTMRQLADASGVSSKTLSRNSDLIECLDFAVNRGGYYKCNPGDLV
jgi:predicted DNA-binding transcriptional regulator YafY